MVDQMMTTTPVGITVCVVPLCPLPHGGKTPPRFSNRGGGTIPDGTVLAPQDS